MTSILLIPVILVAGSLLFYLYYRLFLYLWAKSKYHEFKRRYVIPFQPLSNQLKHDPLTREPFKEGELVVNKCKQLISLDSWELSGRQCPNCPHCINSYFPCNGDGVYRDKINPKPIERLLSICFGFWLVIALLNFNDLSPTKIVLLFVGSFLILIIAWFWYFFKYSEKKTIPQKLAVELNPTSLSKITDHQMIFITVRIMPSGDEFDVEIPDSLTGREIIEELLLNNLMPQHDPQGNLFIYEILIMETGVPLKEGVALAEAGIDDGFTLFVVPKLTAGGYSGNMIYYLPDKFQFRKKAQCTVRIGKKELEEYLLAEGFLDKPNVGNIEINDLMIVRLEENATRPHFRIIGLNEEEQIISDGYFSQWVFELHPEKIGYTSLILRISMPQIIDGFGERRKDVFLLNQEVEITAHKEEYGSGQITLQEIFEWTEQKETLKSEVYKYIGKNETGAALTKLINFFQKSDLELLNAMILFQAQWNEGKNKNLMGLIAQNEWMMIQNKVNYGILEIMKNLENEMKSKDKNLPFVKNISAEISKVV
ncbi:MAG: hypothetical protein H6573_20580 [Lewinellaceae bacterium]|nr:hypothetical protein [Lewinellaceae bacterium]